MVHVVGTVHDVADNPDRVDRIVVRAVEPRMHGTTYVTEESVQFPVTNGVLDFEVLPGPCVVAFLRSHGATTYEKLMVPDVEEATFRECLDAGTLAEEGTRSALEKVVRQIQEELNKATPLVGEVRTLHTEVSNDRTAVDGFAKAAQKSAAEAATSESNAKGSETAAGDFAAVATAAATEAADAMDAAALSAAAFNIYTGTGSPEDKVEAPVGSIYTDSAATNGAIRWIKISGTGGTGWAVEYGDTGWRDATQRYLDMQGPTGNVLDLGEGARILVKRTPTTLTYAFEGPISASRAWTNLFQPPKGYRPEYDMGIGFATKGRLEGNGMFIRMMGLDVGSFVDAGRILTVTFPMSPTNWPISSIGNPV